MLFQSLQKLSVVLAMAVSIIGCNTEPPVYSVEPGTKENVKEATELPEKLTVDARCESVDDCGLFVYQMDDDNSMYCCNTCAETAANKKWMEKAARHCQLYPRPTACPKSHCGDRIPAELACENKKCVARR